MLLLREDSKPFSNMMMQWGSTPEHFGDGGKVQLPLHVTFASSLYYIVIYIM